MDIESCRKFPLAPDALDRLAKFAYDDPLGTHSCKIQLNFLDIIRRMMKYDSGQRVLEFRHRNDDKFDRWINVFLLIASRQISQPLESAELGQSMEKPDSIWWKCKEASLSLLLDIVSSKDASLQWRLKESSYHLSIMNLCIRFTRELNIVYYMSPQTMQLSLECLKQVCDKFLLHDKMKIVYEIIFPLFCMLTEPIKTSINRLFPSEKCTWNQKTSYNLVLVKIYPICCDILSCICRDDEKTTEAIVDYATRMLVERGGKRKHVRGAALSLLASIDHGDIKTRMEFSSTILIDHILPILNRLDEFDARRCICYILEQDTFSALFVDLGFKSVKSLVAVSSQDPVFAVRIKALEALAKITHYCRAAGRSNGWRLRKLRKANRSVAMLQEKLIGQLKELQPSNCPYHLITKYLLASINSIIALYPEESYPVMVAKFSCLNETLCRILDYRREQHQHNIDHQDTDESSEMLLLKVVKQVLVLGLSKNDNISRIEPELLAMVQLVVDQSELDDRDALRLTALGLVELSSGRYISLESLNLMDQFLRLIEREGSNLFVNMCPIIHNFITHQSSPLVKAPHKLNSLFSLCSHILLGHHLIHSDLTRAYAAKLLELVILQFKDNYEFRKSKLSEFVGLLVSVMDRELTLRLSNNESKRVDESRNENENANANANANAHDIDTYSGKKISLKLASKDPTIGYVWTQIIVSIGAAIHTDFYKSFESFGCIEESRSVSGQAKQVSLFELFFEHLMLLSSMRSDIEARLWQFHECRLLILTLCSLARLPKETRPECVNSSAASLLGRILGLFDSLHRMFEEQLADLGHAQRVKHPERAYLSWRPESERSMASAIDRNDGLRAEISLLRATLAELERIEPEWQRSLVEPLDAMQARLLADLFAHANEADQQARQDCGRRYLARFGPATLGRTLRASMHTARTRTL